MCKQLSAEIRICIDASNILGGGGVTHLVSILNNHKNKDDFNLKVFVFGRANVLEKIDTEPWLVKKTNRFINGNALLRFYWQKFRLKSEAERLNCDLLFSPGGRNNSKFRPFVTMSRNLLPFEAKEIHRYRSPIFIAKMHILRFMQIDSMKKAAAVIFLNQSAKIHINQFIKIDDNRQKIIPHGVNNIFRHSPRVQLQMKQAKGERNFKLIYVSDVAPYKNHEALIEGLQLLRKQFTNFELILIGNGTLTEVDRFRKSKKNAEHDHLNWITVMPNLNQAEISSILKEADVGVFASSCENMPNILLEKMAAGLPIVSADYPAMRELLGDTGTFFDHRYPVTISTQIMRFLQDEEVREKSALENHSIASRYTWERCANDTFDFLLQIVNDQRRNND